MESVLVAWSQLLLLCKMSTKSGAISRISVIPFVCIFLGFYPLSFHSVWQPDHNWQYVSLFHDYNNLFSFLYSHHPDLKQISLNSQQRIRECINTSPKGEFLYKIGPSARGVVRYKHWQYKLLKIFLITGNHFTFFQYDVFISLSAILELKMRLILFCWSISSVAELRIDLIEILTSEVLSMTAGRNGSIIRKDNVLIVLINWKSADRVS